MMMRWNVDCCNYKGKGNIRRDEKLLPDDDKWAVPLFDDNCPVHKLQTPPFITFV